MATQSLDILEEKWSRVRGKRGTQDSRLYPDGYLKLSEDPTAWIQLNPKDRLQRVRRLELDLEDKDDVEEIGDAIGELTHLTHLSIQWAKYLKCLPNVITRLHYLQVLEIHYCDNLQELLANLRELATHLSLNFCHDLQELQASLGHLHSLTHLSFTFCSFHQGLLTSLGELHSLTHLTLSYCDNLQELPTSLGQLHSLTHLSLTWCKNLQALPTSLGELQTLAHFSLSNCHAVKFIPNMKVETLYFGSVKDNHFPSIDGMPRLLSLDLRKSQIKHFSVLGNIKNLPKLRILSLPECFRLETLPLDLNDSLIISVDETHVRKTWKELKIEMMSSFSDSLTGSSSQNHFNISPQECLLFNGAPMLLNLNSYKSVRLLDLSICKDDAEKLTSIKEMSQLTHLYIKGKEEKYNIDLKYLPNTITRLRHLSLQYCDYESFSNCLDMLTNLKSLDLALYKNELPENIDVSVLVNLRCLTLRYGEITSLLDSMAKLSNLKTLVLDHCYGLDSLPTDMNLVKLKLIGTFIHSLPTGLRHLEILYATKDELCDCEDGNTDYLKELVNLETFSITCKYTTYLPSLEGLLNLQELQLKDCFNLRKMPKVGKLNKLCTLNISGTRIMSLPDCITNLYNLKHLILPKCFKKESLPHNFGKELVVTIDDIHEEYYQNMCFDDSYYETSSEDDYEITSDIEEEFDEDVTRISQEGHSIVQTSLHQLQNLPTPVLGASPEFGQAFINNEVTLPHGIFSIEPQVTQFSAEHHFHKRQKAICKDSQHVLHSLQNQQTKVNNNHQSDDRKVFSKKKKKSDDRKVTTQKINIPLEKIQSLMSSNITIKEAAEILDVSPATVKRRLQIFTINWPRRNEKKRRRNEKKRPRIQKLAVGDNVPIESNVVNYSSNPTLTTKTVQECPAHGSMDDNKQKQEHLDILAGISELLLNNESPDESSSTFVVKATCHGHTGRFNFCPTKSIDQLKEEVKKKLELEDDDFHMEYKDEEQEWVIMNWMSDLIDATSLVETKSSTGRDVIRLRVTHKNKSCCSTSMTTHTSQVIHDSFQSDIHQKPGLGLFNTQWKSRDGAAGRDSSLFPWPKDIPYILLPYLFDWIDVQGDGNCGFRALTVTEMGGEDKWSILRQHMSDEIKKHKQQYAHIYMTAERVENAIHRIGGHVNGPASLDHWMDATDLYVAATLLNIAIAYYGSVNCNSYTNWLILPLRRTRGTHGVNKLVHILWVNQNHYVQLLINDDTSPLPLIQSNWRVAAESTCRDFERQYRSRIERWDKLIGGQEQQRRNNTAEDAVNLDSP